MFEKDDYIEMDDILTSELGASLTEIPQQFLDPGEFGEFNEFDQLFHDISMFLEMEPILQGDSAGPSSLSNTSDKEHQHFQVQTPENKLYSIMDPNPNPNQLTDDMKMMIRLFSLINRSLLFLEHLRRLHQVLKTQYSSLSIHLWCPLSYSVPLSKDVFLHFVFDLNQDLYMYI